MPLTTVRVSDRGAARWARGHPWIFRSDVTEEAGEPGLVEVRDPRERLIGTALHSPRSEIRLRRLAGPGVTIDAAWWRDQIAASFDRRLGIDATGFRTVHGEADGLPSLVVDRYDRWLVVQILSAGLETVSSGLLDVLEEVGAPDGILLRNDAPVRHREGLAEEVTLARGTVPDLIEVREGTVRYLAAPWTGQKTGAFLDQRPNRLRAAAWCRPGGRALDCFTYHGSFALHLAAVAREVTAIDSSADALARAEANARLNGVSTIRWELGDVFDRLRAFEHTGARFETIVVDPPAFAKHRGAVGAALRGYREVNLRALRLLTPGGVLVTASCSHHVRRPAFYDVVAAAAADSGRRVTILEHLGPGVDHPECLTIPETGYLKGLILRVE